METITQKISLDFSTNYPVKRVHVKQGETYEARKIEVWLYNNGELYTHDDDSVTFFGKLEGAETAYSIGCAISTRYVQIPVLIGMTAIAGVMHCELKITGDSQILKTPTFDIVIEPSISGT